MYLKLEHSKFWSNFEFDRNIVSGTGAWADPIYWHICDTWGGGDELNDADMHPGFSHWSREAVKVTTLPSLAVMMTSWNGNTSCITAPLWGESIGYLWIAFTKDHWCRALMFPLMSACANYWSNSREAGEWKCFGIWHCCNGIAGCLGQPSTLPITIRQSYWQSVFITTNIITKKSNLFLYQHIKIFKLTVSWNGSIQISS